MVKPFLSSLPLLLSTVLYFLFFYASVFLFLVVFPLARKLLDRGRKSTLEGNRRLSPRRSRARQWISINLFPFLYFYSFFFFLFIFVLHPFLFSLFFTFFEKKKCWITYWDFLFFFLRVSFSFYCKTLFYQFWTFKIWILVKRYYFIYILSWLRIFFVLFYDFIFVLMAIKYAWVT